MPHSQPASITTPQSSKAAICWLDVFLLIGTLFVGLILWGCAGRSITWRHRLEIPQKETFEQTAQFPLRNAELAMAQDDLKATQAKLFEQQMEATRLAARIQTAAALPSAINGNSAPPPIRRAMTA
jgi:hypothetical protein